MARTRARPLSYAGTGAGGGDGRLSVTRIALGHLAPVAARRLPRIAAGEGRVGVRVRYQRFPVPGIAVVRPGRPDLLGQPEVVQDSRRGRGPGTAPGTSPPRARTRGWSPAAS